MKFKSILLVAIIAASFIFSGCGKRNHYCQQVAPELSRHLSESIAADQITVGLEEEINNINMAFLDRFARRTNDPNVIRVRNFVSEVKLRQAYIVHARELTEIKHAADTMYSTYCDRTSVVEEPATPPTTDETSQVVIGRPVEDSSQYFSQCVAEVRTLTFGISEQTIGACQRVQTAEAVQCVSAAVDKSINSISPFLITACSAYTLPSQASCITEVGNLTFGITEFTIRACVGISTSYEVDCVRSIVSSEINSISPHLISACNSDR